VLSNWEVYAHPVLRSSGAVLDNVKKGLWRVPGGHIKVVRGRKRNVEHKVFYGDNT
jgi:hypothetical protein